MFVMGGDELFFRELSLGRCVLVGFRSTRGSGYGGCWRGGGIRLEGGVY